METAMEMNGHRQKQTNKQASKQTKSSKKHKCAQAYLYTESTCV